MAVSLRRFYTIVSFFVCAKFAKCNSFLHIVNYITPTIKTLIFKANLVMNASKFPRLKSTTYRKAQLLYDASVFPSR